jgi:hypothetical protein
MKFLHIDKNNTDYMNELIRSRKDIFLLIYMDGCEPCNKVRPEWAKIENIFNNSKKNKNTKNNPNVVIANVESDDMKNIQLKSMPNSFPTIKYISNRGEIEEDYDKERDVSSLIEWINSKSKPRFTRKHIHGKQKTRKIGGKWSRKYKASINCKKPKGFSQKQHCKYGRNNI